MHTKRENVVTVSVCVSFLSGLIGMLLLYVTETSPYKSDPRFPQHIVKMGEIWGRNQNDVIIFYISP